jgi:hypothetical protein
VNLKKSSHPAARPTQLNAVMDAYLTWHEADLAAIAAYQCWRGASRSEREGAFAAYRAALDREEHAASAYRRFIEQTQSP